MRTTQWLVLPGPFPVSQDLIVPDAGPFLVALRSWSRMRLEARARTPGGPSPDLGPARTRATSPGCVVVAPGGHPPTRMRLSLAQRPERRPDLLRKQLWLFPRGEVAPPGGLVEIGEGG